MKVFCKSCGMKLVDTVNFCPVCGKPIYYDFNIKEPREKTFNWGIRTSNDKAIAEVNAWLKSQKIIIHKIQLLGRLNGFNSRTVLNYLSIKYHESNAGETYQMDYFANWKWIAGRNVSELNDKLNQWKAKNPDKKVVSTTRIGHQYEGGATMSLYYFYR